MSKIYKKTRNLLTVFLSIMLFVSIPISVYAENVITNGVINENVDEDNSQIRQGEIIGEDISKRDEYTKHFRLDNGANMAVSYDLPIHFAEDGKWVDYDNTLVESTSSINEMPDEVSKDGYINKKSNIKPELFTPLPGNRVNTGKTLIKMKNRLSPKR